MQTTQHAGGNLQTRQMTVLDDPEAIAVLVDRVPSYPQADLARELLDTTRAIQAVDTQDGRELTSIYRKDLATHADGARKWFDPFTSAAHRLHKALTGRRAAVVQGLEAERERLGRLCVDYDREVERERRQAEEELRRAQEAAARAQREELERQAQEKAAALEAEGRVEQAAQTIEEAAELGEAIQEQAAAAAPLSPPPPRIAGESTAIDWTLDMDRIDLKALATAAVENWAAYGHYLEVNLTAARQAAKAQKKLFSVPGLVAVGRPRLSGRRS